MQNSENKSTRIDSTEATRFVLEAVDPCTQCIVRDVQFDAGHQDALSDILCVDSTSLLHGCSYTLTREVACEIKLKFGLSLELQMTEVSIRRARELDQLPYKVHTSRELLLMLAGEKPLASFVGRELAVEDEAEVPEALFAPYVNEGRFHKRVYAYPAVMKAGSSRLRQVLYALGGEEWRFDE